MLKNLMIVLAGVVLLAGCSNVRDSLGFTRKSPDEFAVVKRAPLSLPPEYNLRPPAPGAPRPQDQQQVERAREAVFGSEQVAPARSSDGEETFLNYVGAEQADPGIRDILNQESTTHDVYDENLADKIIFWRESPQAPAPVIDAEAEAARIRKNKEEEKAVNEGEVPVIEPKERAPLEGLF